MHILGYLAYVSMSCDDTRFLLLLYLAVDKDSEVLHFLSVNIIAFLQLVDNFTISLSLLAHSFIML